MLKSLFAVGSDDAEGLDVRRVDAYIGDNADIFVNSEYIHESQQR